MVSGLFDLLLTLMHFQTLLCTGTNAGHEMKRLMEEYNRIKATQPIEAQEIQERVLELKAKRSE